MKKIGFLLAILLVAGVCAMADEAVTVQGELLFADVDAVALSQAEMEAVEGARHIREDAGESRAYAQDKTDYKQGRSYDGLAGETVRASVRGSDGNTRKVLYEITGARQTSKNHLELQGKFYRSYKNSDSDTMN